MFQFFAEAAIATLSLGIIAHGNRVPTGFDLDSHTLIAGGAAVRAVVTLNTSTVKTKITTTVRFFSSDPDALELPESVVIPANVRTAEIFIRARATVGKVVTVYASAGGKTLPVDLTIQPNGTMKGFINDDSRRDLSDAIYLLTFLFSGGNPPQYPAFADINSSGKVDISDAVALLVFLFSDSQISSICSRDPSTLPGNVQLYQQLVTDGDQVCMYGSFPEATYRVVLKGFSYPNGRLISGNQVVGERRLIYCACVPAVRGLDSGPDGESFFRVCFTVPLEAPSGEYEVNLLPAGASCPAGNLAGSGCVEDDCQVGPLKMFVQPSCIVSLLEEFDINDNSEPAGDHPAELFFTFASQTGEPDASQRFPVQFADSYPGGRPGSQHLTNDDHTVFRPDVPVFVGREADMERTECDEECDADPDPARCRIACAEAARRMNNNLAVSLGGAELDCLDGCSSIWDEVAGIGTTALGCLVGVKLGNPKTGCAVGATLGAIFESKLEDALEDEDDALGTVDFNFTRGARPFWGAGATAPPAGLSKSDIDVGVYSHRLPGFRIVEAKLQLRSVDLIEADDEPCYAPDELFFETRASLGINGRLGESTRFPATEGIPVAEGQTQDLSSFSLSAGGGADSPLLYVEIGVWDYDGEDEAELIGLHSTTIFLGDLLETFGSQESGTDFVQDGREMRRVQRSMAAQVTGWNSGERCDCSGIWACAFNPHLPHGKANIYYDVDVTWEKYPQ